MRRSRSAPKTILSFKGQINWQACILVIVAFSCGKPEQPPLTEKERLFTHSLESKFNAKVEREIDVMMLGRFYEKGKRGGYWVNVDLPCDKLLSFDAVARKKTIDTLARDLFYNVLDSNKKYNLITIAFDCDTSNSLYQSRVFDYGTDSLHRF